MAIIDKKEFEGLVKEYAKADEEREELIKKSREILKLSKQTIYAVQRNELKEAEGSLKEMEKELANFKKIAKNNQRLAYSGTYKITMQEYVEAAAFFELIKNDKLLSIKSLDIDAEHYMLGLCDLSGEVVRKAINAAINEKYKETLRLRDFVSDLYAQLMKFDFSNGELRKKYDSVKYDLKKLEDLILELKLKGKL